MTQLNQDDLGTLPDYVAKIHVFERDGVYYATEKDAESGRVEAGDTVDQALLEYASAVVNGGEAP